MIVDTHMHIYEDRLSEELDNIISEAKELEVEKMICSGINYDTSLKSIKLAKKYNNVYATVGLYPEETIKDESDLSWIKELAKNDKVVAIGEIGLDYYWDTSFKEIQIEKFIKQIKIANELNLPVIVHSRNAVQETFNILKEYRCRGVIHCFGGSLEMAREFTKLGYYIGVGGIVTFKNAKEIKRVVEGIDLDYLLSETDAPYLTPVPHRGELNHPGYTKYIVEEIAKIKNIDIEIVKEKLAENARKLFNI